MATESLHSQLDALRGELSTEQAAHRASKGSHVTQLSQLRQELQEAARKGEDGDRQLKMKDEVRVTPAACGVPGNFFEISCLMYRN